MSMTKIAEIVVGAGGAAEIKFSNVPASFTDLYVVYSLRTAYASTWQQVPVYFNNDSANTIGRNLYGTGSSIASDTATWPQLASNGASSTGSTFSSGYVYIPNYAQTTSTKSFSVDVVTENNGTSAGQNIFAGLWNSTAAINTVQLWGAGQTFQQYSSATLYGISKVPAGGIAPKATGGDIYQNGAYTYHVFKASGTFTPTQTIPNAEVLCIAGGGGGGSYYGGGGGAGGVTYRNVTSTAAGSYPVTIGAGGAGSNPGYGGMGVNSTVNGITANGGGGGGYFNAGSSTTGLAGGSGGGGAMGATANTSRAGGAANQTGSGGATGYGNAGGTGWRGSVGGAYRGGGGGGAGAVGANSQQNDSTSPGSNGGAGLDLWSAWAYATSTGVSGYYAGGGGGSAGSSPAGSGGAGGGGRGAIGGVGSSHTSGTVNTGSGGGADDANGQGSGAGGSGIVIIRYA